MACAKISGFPFMDGDGRKKSYQDYLYNFNAIIHAIRDDRFDFDREAVPICERTVVGNAHRLAASAYFDKDVPTIEVFGNPNSHTWDYRTLQSLDYSPQQIDCIIQYYMRVTKRCHVLFLFPRALDAIEKCEGIIKSCSDIVFHKDFSFTDQGAVELVKLAYGRNDWWVDELTERFVRERFPDRANLRIYVVEPREGFDCPAIKKQVRDIFSSELPCSIHSSDDISEALFYSDYLFNENWVFYINFRHGQFSEKFESKLNLYKSRLEEAARLGNDKKNYCIDSGSVLEFYGIRECNDIDYICGDYADGLRQDERISSHNSEYELLGLNYHEFIENPRFHFFYNGVKVLSLGAVNQFKFWRREQKDVSDLQLIAAFLDLPESAASQVEFYKTRRRRQRRRMRRRLRDDLKRMSKYFERWLRNTPPVSFLRRKMRKRS
jgi:hypothetical protein